MEYLILVIPLAALLSNALRWPPIDKLTCGPRRWRDPSGRDPRRRAPVADEFLSTAHWTVLYPNAVNYRARNACNAPTPFTSPLLLGPVISSVTERRLWVHSLGALHSVSGLAICFWGSCQFNERCGCPSLRCIWYFLLLYLPSLTWTYSTIIGKQVN